MARVGGEGDSGTIDGGAGFQSLENTGVIGALVTQGLAALGPCWEGRLGVASPKGLLAGVSDGEMGRRSSG